MLTPLRRMLVALNVVVASTVFATACTMTGAPSGIRAAQPPQSAQPAPPAEAPGTVPPPRPKVRTEGPARVHFGGPTDAKRLALTFDDGICGDCVGSILKTVEETGAHVTFCPNGMYSAGWRPHAQRIRALIEKGQVTMCNHTMNHKVVPKLSDAEITQQLERNESWIKETFGVSSKPFYRPPYGAHNSRVGQVAAAAGYPEVLMWNGNTEDWRKPDDQQYMKNFREGLKPGGIMLAHGNHMQTARLLPQMIQEARSAGYKLTTVAELLGDPPTKADPAG